MKTLQPQDLKQSDYELLKSQAIGAVIDVVFRPLAQIIAEEYGRENIQAILENVNEGALLRAIRSGRLQYSGGFFYGSMSAELSIALRSLGAKLDRRRRAYALPESQAPHWLLAAAADYQAKAQRAHDRIVAQLENIRKNLKIDIGIKLVEGDDAVDRVEKGWRESARGLEVMPELSPQSRAEMAKHLGDNVKLGIVGFTDEMVLDLRDAVEENARQGYRYDSLVDIIRMRYGVTDRKAEFLARQETSLFMAQFRRRQFAEAGLHYYIWDTSHDVRVRREPNGGHAALNGRMFSYEQKAPASFMSVGEPCNPGEDYNCRCVDRPVVDADYRETQRNLHASGV